MKSFKADYVFPVYADPIKNGIVTIDDHGMIISVTGPDTPPQNSSVEQLSGILCPGFVNTHCHLELSHLKGKVKRNSGLVNFIRDVQSLRTTDSSLVQDAAEKADTEMFDNGIVAVGDIANGNASIASKAKSSLYYHTFIEVFGFLPEGADKIFETAEALIQEFKTMPCSITPHAPYSVSKDLFKLIKHHCETGSKNLLSIHNQECEDENKFYRYKLGSFLDLYKRLGIDISYFKPQARNSIQSVIPLLTNKQDILMVHNTCTNLKDIYFVKRFDRRVNWCFCAGANQYIENRLPKVGLFLDQGFNITLGTDSLASNDKLCLLNEMMILQKNFNMLSTATLIEWGTINGAKFLGIEKNKGTLEPGKTPGLNLITGLNGMLLTPESKVKRLL